VDYIKALNDKKLNELTKNYTLVEELKGRIGDRITKYKTPSGDNVYVKYGEGNSAESLKQENDRLVWLSKLQTDILVPKTLFFKQYDNKAILIISEVPGEQAQRVGKKVGAEKALDLVAKALNDLHSIDVSGVSEYRNQLKDILASFKNRVDTKQINIEEFKAENDGTTPKQALQYLNENKHLFKEDVLVHGDYCLPNVLIDSNNNYGLVDWAYSGIGDKYFDIAPMLKSIKRNFGEEYVDYFVNKYGLKKLDKEKVKYIQLIDQFSYHRL
jgi:aminoglycoside phosphotransferase